MNLPVSSEEYVDTELAAARKRVIQGILPPGYTALDDGSVVGPDGKVVVLPVSAVLPIPAVPTIETPAVIPAPEVPYHPV